MLARFFSILILLVSASLGLVERSAAQELDCTVRIDYSGLPGSDYRFLDDLESDLSAYVNDHRWTDDRFAPHERIDCDLQVVMLEGVTQTTFDAQLIISARRPIYGAVQSSPVIRISDRDWRFSYSQGRSLVHNIDQHDDLVSVIDFYVYLLLGYDYDTFSPLGGTAFFERARRISERADAAGSRGWATVTGRDRHELISDLLDPRFYRLRNAYYTYHFEGLDRFLNDDEAARDAVLDAVRAIGDLYSDVARRYVIDLFFAAKHPEFVALFQDGAQSSRAYQLLSRLDPSHDYSVLLE